MEKRERRKMGGKRKGEKGQGGEVGKGERRKRREGKEKEREKGRGDREGFTLVKIKSWVRPWYRTRNFHVAVRMSPRDAVHGRAIVSPLLRLMANDPSSPHNNLVNLPERLRLKILTATMMFQP